VPGLIDSEAARAFGTQALRSDPRSPTPSPRAAPRPRVHHHSIMNLSAVCCILAAVWSLCCLLRIRWCAARGAHDCVPPACSTRSTHMQHPHAAPTAPTSCGPAPRTVLARTEHGTWSMKPPQGATRSTLSGSRQREPNKEPPQGATTRKNAPTLVPCLESTRPA
jgi:hypothetical protein